MDYMLDPPDDRTEEIEEALAEDLNGNSNVLDGLLAGKEALRYVNRMLDEMGRPEKTWKEALEWLGL